MEPGTSKESQGESQGESTKRAWSPDSIKREKASLLIFPLISVIWVVVSE